MPLLNFFQNELCKGRAHDVFCSLLFFEIFLRNPRNLQRSCKDRPVMMGSQQRNKHLPPEGTLIRRHYNVKSIFQYRFTDDPLRRSNDRDLCSKKRCYRNSDECTYDACFTRFCRHWPAYCTYQQTEVKI